MLSVLIIDSKVLEHYSKYDYFFGHFENNSEVAVCVWNKQSVEDDVCSMLPQLMDAVRNVPEWNAYIICEPHNSVAYLEKDFENRTQFSVNPYERANDENYDPEQDRLLRLVYFLGGRGEDRVEYIQHYQFRAARPNTIYLITPRLIKGIEQQKSFLLTEIRRDSAGAMSDPSRILAGEVDVSRFYSEFWQRYEYSPNCRFLVYDFPQEDHQSYENSWFAFWVAVISMTQNRFGNSLLAPYKLHLLDVQINDERFAEYINRFYTMLLENKEINKSDREKQEQLEREEAANTDITVTTTPIPVTVEFPHFDQEELFANDRNMGKFKDRPVLDEEDWQTQMSVTHEAIGRFYKAIGRGKGEAIDYVHEDFRQSKADLEAKTVTKYDAEELREAMAWDEQRMIELDLGDASDREEFEKTQRKAEKIVKRYMSRRLRKKAAVGLMIACILLDLVGFLPYLIQSFSHGVASFGIALIITLGAMAVPVLCCVGMLQKLKKDLSCLVDLYNATVADCFMKAKQGSELQGEYLTYLLDYLKKHYLLSMAKNNNRHAWRIQKLLIAEAVLDDAVTECETLAAMRGIRPRRITDRYVENVVETVPESRIYLYEEVPHATMALNSTPDVLRAPFSFADRLSLQTEELYECCAYTGEKEETK